MDPLAALKANPLLEGFSDDGARIIQAAVTLRQVPAGAPIFVEQMQGESVFLLVEGSVELFVHRGGQERVLTILRGPDHFGELSLVKPGPRRVNAHAQTSTTLLEITRRDFLQVQKQRPQACLKLLLNIVERFAAKAQAATPAFEQIILQDR